MGFNVDEQINFLKKIDFFENFDDHELHQFLTVTKWLKVAAGTLIIKENTMERVFYVLVKGEVSVFKTLAAGKTLELTVLKAGACFGEMSLVMDVKRTAGVIARCDSFLLMVEPEIISTSNVFLQLKFYKRFCEILVSRLILANERMAIIEAPPLPVSPTPAAKSPARAGAATGVVTPPAPPVPEAAVSPLPSEISIGTSAEVTLKGLTTYPPRKDPLVKKAVQRKIATVRDLPFNRGVAERIYPLLRGESDNTLLLADLIQLDPGLSWRVMQLGNSSYYRRSLPVKTVPHAMITVGIKNIQEALFDTIKAGPRRKPFGGVKAIASSFWRHAVVVARIAVLLHDVIRLSMNTDVYLAGLLHDIGLLAIDAIEPQFYPHLSDPTSELCANLSLAEATYVGVDHGEAGAILGEGIGLSETYLDVMRFHHSPLSARANQLSVALIHLADLFATAHGCGYCPAPLETVDHPIDYAVWGVIQEQHRSFSEVNIADFITNFDLELTKTWSGIVDGLPT